MDYDRVVVDSSIVIKWFTVEPFTDQAHEILDGYEFSHVTWIGNWQ